MWDCQPCQPCQRTRYAACSLALAGVLGWEATALSASSARSWSSK